MTLTLSLIPQFPISAGAAGLDNLKVGDYLQMGTYNNAPIIWRCIGYDHEGSPIMFSDQIISIKPFDAQTTEKVDSHARDTSDTQRANYGSNYWPDSNLRTWLNSAAPAGYVDWNGNPPTAKKLAWYDKSSSSWKGANQQGEHVGYNAYDKEAGFRTNFTAAELAAVKSVTHDSLVTGAATTPKESELSSVTGSGAFWTNDAQHGGWTIDTLMEPTNTPTGVNYASAYKEQVTDTFFCLDVKELYEMVYKNEKSQEGGAKVFDDGYYIGTLTQGAINQAKKDTNFVNDLSFNPSAGSKYHYWLRSPAAGNAYVVRGVYSDGSVNGTWASYGSLGVRPAFCLNLTSLENLGGKGTKSRPYRVGKADAYGGAASGAKPPTAKSNLVATGSEQELIDDTEAKSYLAGLPGATEEGDDPATISATCGFSCAFEVRIIPLLVVSSASSIFKTTLSANGLIFIYITS